MAKIYYLDTSIYIDYYENREDRFRPLGEWAHDLLYEIKQRGDILLVSDLIIEELEKYFPKEKVLSILRTYIEVIKFIEYSTKQVSEAKKLAKIRKVPINDALHAIIARDNKAIMVTRDHHFEKLVDITIPRKPEELL